MMFTSANLCESNLPASIAFRALKQVEFATDKTSLSAPISEITVGLRCHGCESILGSPGKENGNPHDALHWRLGKQMAIRQGDWKLVMYDLPAKNKSGLSHAKLYNLKDDIGEATDLSTKHPDKVKELQAPWNAWQNVAPLWVAMR